MEVDAPAFHEMGGEGGGWGRKDLKGTIREGLQKREN